MRANKEYNICKGIAQYLRLQHPHVLFHFDLAGLNLSKAQAGMTKMLNSRGWPDLIILHPTNGKVLFLEVKTDGTKLIKRNGEYVTPHIAEQAKVLKDIMSKGHMSGFVIGLDSSIKVIDQFLKS